MMKKLLAFTILILFIGLSVVSISGNKIEYIHNYPFISDAVDISKRSSACDHLVYFGGSPVGPWNCWLFEAKLNDIGNSTCICNGLVPSFAGGSTCLNDEIIIACTYGNGAFFEIDPQTCEITWIGGGGVGLNGLSMDLTTSKIYGASSTSLYEIDSETGSQTLVGNFGSDVLYMIDIAFDADGVLYGWDLGDKLWTIDTETGDTTVVGPLGYNLNYAQSGGFCLEDDILYLAAYIISPFNGSYLLECDEDTGECTIVDQFEDNAEISIFVIPWNFRPNTPSDPVPSNGAIGLPIDTNLSWMGGDPDNDEVKYDIYFGNSFPPPKIISNQSSKNYDPGILEYCTTYYWQIVAWDEHGAYTKGPIWNFTIRTKTKDIYGLEGDWKTLEVKMSKSKQTTINCWFQQLLDRFPFLQKIIEILERYK